MNYVALFLVFQQWILVSLVHGYREGCDYVFMYMLHWVVSLVYGRASQHVSVGAPVVHSASTLGPQKNAELHIHNEGINNKCILNLSSRH